MFNFNRVTLIYYFLFTSDTHCLHSNRICAHAHGYPFDHGAHVPHIALVSNCVCAYVLKITAICRLLIRRITMQSQVLMQVGFLGDCTFPQIAFRRNILNDCELLVSQLLNRVR